MGLVICLVIGTFAGWLVGAIQEVDEGIFARMGIGLLGGLIGNLFAGFLSDAIMASMASLTWLSAVLSLVGAFLLLGVARTSSRYNSRDGV